MSLDRKHDHDSDCHPGHHSDCHHHHHHSDCYQPCDNESLLPIGDKSCTGTTGCDWDGTLRKVVTKPICFQKVYDAALFNLQALSTVNNVTFTPALPKGSVVENILDIKCRKFFNPSNIDDNRNFLMDPETMLSGGEFLIDENSIGAEEDSYGSRDIEGRGGSPFNFSLLED